MFGEYTLAYLIRIIPKQPQSTTVKYSSCQAGGSQLVLPSLQQIASCLSSPVGPAADPSIRVATRSCCDWSSTDSEGHFLTLLCIASHLDWWRKYRTHGNIMAPLISGLLDIVGLLLNPELQVHCLNLLCKMPIFMFFSTLWDDGPRVARRAALNREFVLVSVT